jgi:CheY-like chemotaxis protein
VARKNSSSRMLRELAKQLLTHPLFDLEFASDKRDEIETSVVRRWVTYDGHATPFPGDRPVDLSIAGTPPGKPSVVRRPEIRGWPIWRRPAGTAETFSRASALDPATGRSVSFPCSLPPIAVSLLSSERLPLPSGWHDGPAVRPNHTCAMKTPAAKRLYVLVVDDNRDAADSLATVFATGGHDTRTAYSRDDVRRVVHGGVRLDAVFMDIGLPGTDGYAVAKELTGVLGYQPLLVAVTGHQALDDRSDREGFDLHFLKPVDPAVLLKVLSIYGQRDRGAGANRRSPSAVYPSPWSSD